MKKIEQAWIETGYRCFACEGPSALRVERISREVGKNKSSFYHLFADMEVFIDRLLGHHLNQAKAMTRKEANAKHEADLIKVLMAHKTDLLFNRQLRVYRENSNFEKCFVQTNQLSLPALLPVWKKVIGLSENTYLAQMVLQLSLENFYLQITDETLTEPWLREYFANIRQMVNHFKKSNAIGAVDGSV